ncbi:hypothetical protein ACFL7D_08710, partial [candidate division KSB1 bacterium]
LFLSVLIIVTSNSFAQDRKYGKEIIIKEKTDVADVIKNPENFSGKNILIEGIITSICKERGIWIDITGTGTYETIKCIVNNNYFAISPYVTGKTGTVEGVFKKYASNDPLLLNIMQPRQCHHCRDECFVNNSTSRRGMRSRGRGRNRSRNSFNITAAPDSLNVVMIKGAVIK